MCTDVVNDDLVIDDVALEADPSCQTDAALADPGFESGLSVVGTKTITPNFSTAEVVAEGTAAHGGTHDLQLSANAMCSIETFMVPAVTPAASAAGGPALTFWYRYPGSTTLLQMENTSSTFTPVRDGGWHAGKVCLDPRFPGRPANVEFYMFGPYPSSGPCGLSTFETLSLDDFAVTNDPACPGM
jgi:hypothetical protein